jgi:transcriptional regulator with XRE-family HTH domain
MPPLWQVRRTKGLSLAALARASGVSKTALWEIEVGRTLPRPETIAALATALGVAADTIEEFTQPPKGGRHDPRRHTGTDPDQPD